jgi:glutamate formiminotransferase/formiminotetrahydrofolate cyclodeaminase
VDELRQAASALAEAIDTDAGSYDAVLAAIKLPKESKEEQQRREAAIQKATQMAALVPLRVAQAAAEIFERLGQLEAISSPSMLSDLRVGRLMAAAGARGALENVAINSESITDAAFVAKMRSEAAAVEARLTQAAKSASSKM